MARPVASGAAGLPITNMLLGERLVRNLRDLQLDDELDFPDIVSHSFDAKDSVHNQAARIRKAEWACFHLLHLWNPVSATKELGPHYPAYDPKQSLDLRGAIFNLLSGMKKEGIFPKELILRKTMFDECKGPKFEELLVALSTSVLLKCLDRDKQDVSVLKKCLLRDDGVDQAGLQIYEAIYRGHLSHLLNERQNLRRRWQRFGRVMKVKEDEIRQRRREHELKLDDAKQPRIPGRRLDRLQTYIERDWTTSSEWRTILLKSDQHLPDKSLLERPYDEVWKHASEDSLYHFRPERARSSLQRLEYHIDKQNQRISRWRDLQKMLTPAVSPPPIAQAQTESFDDRSTSPELGTTKYERVRHNRTASRDSVTPPRPSTARRRTSSQQSPLALVTEGVSQLNLVDRGTPEKAPSRSPGLSHPLNSASEKANRRRSNTVIYSPHPSAGAKSPMDELGEDDGSPDGYFDSSLEFDNDATDIINSVLQADPSPIKPNRPLSLSERARLSMAPNNAQNNPRSDRARSTSPVKQEPYQPRDRPLSLALDERTRQSMSIIAASMAPPPLPQQFPRDDTSPRPVTSRRVTVTKRSSRSPEKRQRAPTPDLSHVDESFLAENIDEDTIFMSRPRIAHSPPLQPVGRPSVGEYRDDISVEDYA